MLKDEIFLLFVYAHLGLEIWSYNHANPNIPAATEWLAGLPNTKRRGGRLSFLMGIRCSE